MGDPESFTGKHPPTIHMFSKYERRTDTRTYGDRKKLYEGGAEVLRAEWLESLWKEKFPSSPSVLPANFPSGSESDPAKRLVIPRLLMARRMPVLMLPTLRKSLKRKRKRRRRRRKRRNDLPATPSIWSTQLHQLLHKR